MSATKQKLTDTAKELTYKHRPIQYSFCRVDLAQPSLFVTDPWGILEGHLTSKLESATGQNRAKYKKSLYFARQAEQFSRAARSVDLPTKSTLLYYSMMNLAKSFLVYKNRNPGGHHGIKGTATSIKLDQPDHGSTFAELSKLLNGHYAKGDRFTFDQLTARTLEIHKIDNLWLTKSQYLKFWLWCKNL